MLKKEFILVEEQIQCLAVDDEGNVIFFSEPDNKFWKVDKSNKKQNIPERSTTWGQYRGMIHKGSSLILCSMYDHTICEFSLVERTIYTLTGKRGEEGRMDGSLSRATFNYPWGIAMDKQGDIYITVDHCVRKIQGMQTVITVCGHKSWRGIFLNGTTKDAQFNHPAGIGVSSDGIVYIADCHNHCIRKVQNGMVSTLTGTPNRKNHKDGSFAEALFAYPRSMTLVGDQFLFVADDTGLRRISLLENTVQTVSWGDHRALTSDQHGNVFVATSKGIFKFSVLWDVERILWIGNMKEKSPSCLLSLLPRDMVKIILGFYRASWNL